MDVIYADSEIKTLKLTGLMRSGSFLGFRITLPRLQTEEQLSAVGERNAFAARTGGEILGLVALDHDFGARRQLILFEAEPVQIVRASAFDHPSDYLAVIALHV